MRPRLSGRLLHPTVVVFHGGGWLDGSKEETSDRVCRRYLQKGFLVANVEYRQGAVGPAAEDASAALAWVIRHASDYRIDLDRIVVTGESAGAQLALLAAFRSDERVAAVVNFYGVTDFLPLLDRPAIRQVLPAVDREATARSLSPLTYVRRGLPPVFSIHGTADEVVPIGQTEALTRAIVQAGGKATELSIEGGKHGFSRRQQEEAYEAVFDFLGRRRTLEAVSADPPTKLLSPKNLQIGPS